MAVRVGATGEVAGSGFVVEREDGVDRIRIPVRRHWYLTLVTVLRLATSSVGEVIGIALVSQGPFHWFGTSLFLVWTWMWLVTAHAFAGLFWARETISLSGGRVETRFGLWPGECVRRFDPAAIRNLKAGTPDDLIMTLNPTGFERPAATNVGLMLQRGAVSFDYKGQTTFIAHDLEKEQGREVVAWLAARLPLGAVAE